MHNKNKFGAKINPNGTPNCILHHWNLISLPNSSYTYMYCFLSVTKNLILTQRNYQKIHFFDLIISSQILWSTLPNAWERSMKIYVVILSYKPYISSASNSKIACVVDLLLIMRLMLLIFDVSNFCIPNSKRPHLHIVDSSNRATTKMKDVDESQIARCTTQRYSSYFNYTKPVGDSVGI